MRRRARSRNRRSASSWGSASRMTGASGASRQKPSTIQDADPGDDPPDTRDQPAAADRSTEAIPHWMARLLRFLPDPTCAHELGGVDPPKITLVSLAAVAERA